MTPEELVLAALPAAEAVQLEARFPNVEASWESIFMLPVSSLKPDVSSPARFPGESAPPRAAAPMPDASEESMPAPPPIPAAGKREAMGLTFMHCSLA